MTSEDSAARSVTIRVPSTRGLGRLIAAAAVLAVVAGVVVLGIRSHDLAAKNSRLQHGLSSFELDALTTAKSYAVTFATYRYSDLDADFAATEAHSVDPFLSQYRSETAQLRPTLVQLKAVSTATIVSAGIASISSTGALIDIFLNQTIHNAKGTHVDAPRVEMTLVRSNVRWLIAKVRLP